MRRNPVVWIGAAAALAFVLLVVVDGSRSVEIRITDPTFIVRGARVAVDCVRDGRLPPRRVMVAILAGTAVAVVSNALFNLFRFGDLTNIYYDQPETRVPGVGRRLSLAVANWFAPNVGVLWFWFLAATVLGGLV